MRNVGDVFFYNTNISDKELWIDFVNTIKISSKIFLTMAMAAIGLSTNLKDLNKMGYKPFIVGFVSLLTVGFVSLVAINYLSGIILN